MPYVQQEQKGTVNGRCKRRMYNAKHSNGNRNYVLPDEEYGFEVYALIKGDEKTLKRFAFYEKSKNNQDNFKDKIQKTIAEVVKRDYGVEASQYVSVDYVADDQHRIYVLPQNEQYAPFEYLKAVEPKENYFGVNDFDNVDAILFRFKRESRCIWAYQSVQPILIPNKKKRKFFGQGDIYRRYGQVRGIYG